MKKIIMASLVALATTSGFLLNNQPVQAHSRRYDHSLPHGYYPFYRSPISYCYPVTHWLIDEDAAYHRTKGWMHSFMLGVAVEQAKHGVRANCICPGAIDTAWTHKKDGPMNAKMEKTLVDATPMARRGTPEEIANVYAFIASDEASYVTGALWLADGGVTTAKGAAGADTPFWLRLEPKGELRLDHSREGLENKETKTLI